MSANIKALISATSRARKRHHLLQSIRASSTCHTCLSSSRLTGLVGGIHTFICHPMAPNQICLQCGMQDKDKDHQFCSSFCADVAASRAPELLPVPSNHVMYQNGVFLLSDIRHHMSLITGMNIVKEQYLKQWEAGSKSPKIKAIFLITWDPVMRATFEQYRFVTDPRLCRYLLTPCLDSDHVSWIRGLPKNKAEVKRFRSEARACLLGEGGNTQLCMQPMGDCRLCTAIRTGFVYSLHSKRNAVLQGKQ